MKKIKIIILGLLLFFNSQDVFTQNIKKINFSNIISIIYCGYYNSYTYLKTPIYVEKKQQDSIFSYENRSKCEKITYFDKKAMPIIHTPTILDVLSPVEFINPTTGIPYENKNDSINENIVLINKDHFEVWRYKILKEKRNIKIISIYLLAYTKKNNVFYEVIPRQLLTSFTIKIKKKDNRWIIKKIFFSNNIIRNRRWINKVINQ